LRTKICRFLSEENGRLSTRRRTPEHASAISREKAGELFRSPAKYQVAVGSSAQGKIMHEE
jgi:hypothetical protein